MYRNGSWESDSYLLFYFFYYYLELRQLQPLVVAYTVDGWEFVLCAKLVFFGKLDWRDVAAPSKRSRRRPRSNRRPCDWTQPLYPLGHTTPMRVILFVYYSRTELYICISHNVECVLKLIAPHLVNIENTIWHAVLQNWQIDNNNRRVVCEH